MKESKIKTGLDIAYKNAGENAYFANGFRMGVEFAEENFQGYNMLTQLGNLPENMPLYKDSGLWQVRSDDMEEVVFQQGVEEPFEKFIERVFYSTNKPEDVIIKD